MQEARRFFAAHS